MTPPTNSQQDRRQGKGVRACASESRPAAGADLTSSLTIRLTEGKAVGPVAHAGTGGARPRLLDLFCCAGGCSEGYRRAGFDVVGVDIEPQPHYPFEFHQADALDYLGEHWPDFDAIAASPTCQTRARVTAWRGSRANHPDTLTPTLALLRRLPAPYIVENVTEAVTDGTMRADYLLCGSQFGLPIRRHRAFETNWPGYQLQPPCHHKRGDLPFEHKNERAFADAMGCGWMTNREARQAIPPAYTEFIGEQLIEHIATRKAAV